MHAGHAAQSLRLGLELWMPQKPPHIHGRLIRHDIQPDKAVRGMGKTTVEKVGVAREESWLFQSVKQHEDVGVPDAGAGNILADDAAADTLGAQQVALFQRDVLVEQVHATARSVASSPLAPNRA
jgi:hypothetical protein